MAKAGDDFHNTVEKIEKSLNKNKDISIVSKEFVSDKVSGNKREHDILVKYDDGNKQFTWAIECKDWKRKVDQPTVETFITKLTDTGMDKGTIVSSSGFTKNAITKAQSKNIECFSLKTASEQDWHHSLKKIVIKQHVLTYVFVAMLFDFDLLEPFAIYSKSKKRKLSNEELLQLGNDVFNKIPHKPDFKREKTFPITIKNNHDLYVITHSGKKLFTDEIGIITKYYTVETEDFYFSFFTYDDETAKKVKGEFAIAPIILPSGQKGTVTVQKNSENEYEGVVFIDE